MPHVHALTGLTEEYLTFCLDPVTATRLHMGERMIQLEDESRAPMLLSFNGGYYFPDILAEVMQ